MENIKKAFMLLGKGIIVLNLLYPIPFYYLKQFPGWIYELTGWEWIFKLPYLTFRLIGAPYDMFLDKINLWPQLEYLAFGVLLCAIARHKSKYYDEQKYALVSGGFLLKDMCRLMVRWGLPIIGGFIALVWGIVGIYYSFIYIEITVPVLFAVLLFGFLVRCGVRFYRRYKHNK